MSGKTTFGIQGQKAIQDEIDNNWIVKGLTFTQLDREISRAHITMPDFQRDELPKKTKAIQRKIINYHLEENILCCRRNSKSWSI